jgi:NADPH oxidase 2
MKHSSGLDFKDRDRNSPLDQHPDLNLSNEGLQPVHLHRNKTERRRLQGLQVRKDDTHPVMPYQPKGWRQKFDIWMINEGGKQLFITVWVFLHLLVATFGFLNYQLKDNLVTARTDFGITYRQFSFRISQLYSI